MDERVFISLGILKVAAVLEISGLQVEVIDLSGVKNYEEAIYDYCIRRPEIKWFGITSTTPQFPATTKIVKTIRRNAPDAKIIIGGPHATLVNAAYKLEKRLGKNGRAVKAIARLQSLFDVIVAGDGEEAIFQAFGQSAGAIVDADNTASPLFLTNRRLTELPFPARHLVDLESYHYSIDGVPATSLIAQLGCPFGCGFCGGRESSALRKIRTRTSENIVSEIVHLHHTYGMNGFMLYDDELNVNRDMVTLMRLIAKTQQDLDVEWRLRGFIKSHLFTDEQADVMYAAGFRWILVGFESGSPEILETINKRATREENTRCLEIAHKHGLKVKALMSIGHPGESPETIQASKDWLIQNRPDDFDVSIITPYPGTPYFDHAVMNKDGFWVYTSPKNGDQLLQVEVDYAEVESYYKGDPNGGYRSCVFTKDISADGLVSARNTLEKEVREILEVPYNVGAPSIQYEHSMGQHGFPSNILRTTDEVQCVP